MEDFSKKMERIDGEELEEFEKNGY